MDFSDMTPQEMAQVDPVCPDRKKLHLEKDEEKFLCNYAPGLNFVLDNAAFAASLNSPVAFGMAMSYMIAFSFHIGRDFAEAQKKE